ncbi:hypothetical protein HYR54_10620 [Candidatus Acetothermia bacterium]|nr:hypothetical protein [Candidatus Acetothermia bacterium]
MLKWISIVVGVLLALIGLIWTLQGINVLGGSFMSGQPFWAVMGVIAIVVGVGLVICGARRP